MDLARVPGLTGPSRPERRQLTVIFVDIIDSTSLSERIDPEEFFTILTEYRKICDEQIQRFGGHIARTVGDGLLAYFGLPQAHEDDPERAIRAGLSIIGAIREREFRIAQFTPVHLKLRVAANTGIVVVGGLTGEAGVERRDVFGSPAHVAARIQAIASPNTVVVGIATYELVRGAFHCTYVGEQDIKGIKHPVGVWRVDSVAESESRFERTRTYPLVPMIGRNAETATLRALWDKSVTRSGTVAVISGDPGIGKSRLVQSFRSSLRSTSIDTPYLQCSPFHVNTPFAPEIEWLRRATHYSESDAPIHTLEKLRVLLATATTDVENAIRYYGALLSIPSCDTYRPADLSLPWERERVLQTMLDVLAAASRRRPVLMIVEDVHWIDPTTLEFLKRSVGRIANERIFLIVTHRAYYNPDWLSGPSVNAIPLQRLAAQESEQMVQAVAEGIWLSRKVLKTIIDRTDGIPLFIEEFTRAILDSGTPPRVDGRLALTGSLPEPLVPASLHDSLMERLDRLGDAKRVAQVASVFGRQFGFDSLHRISGVPRFSLLRSLRKLEAAGLLHRQGKAANKTYAFKHALIQETAYGSLLREDRRQFHASAALWLSQTAASDSSKLAVLGYHYSRAGMVLKAIQAWLDAGKAALSHSAYKEAVAHLKEGAELISKLEICEGKLRFEIDLRLTLAMAYTGMLGWGAALSYESYIRALELCEREGSIRQNSMALWGVSVAELVGSRLKAALDRAQAFIQFANRCKDDEAALMAHTVSLLANFFSGRLREARASVDFIFDRYDPSAHHNLVQIYQHDPKIIALIYAGHIDWVMGHPCSAKFCCEQARLLARRLAHPFMLSLALTVGTADFFYEHDLDLSLTSVREGIELAKENGLRMYEMFGALWAIEATVANDPRPATLERLSSLVSRLLASDSGVHVPLYEVLLAQEFGRLGDFEVARQLGVAAQELMHRTGERWFEPEVYRVRATLCCAGPNPDYDAASQLFATSLNAARELSATGWELRSAISFARLLTTLGKPLEARSVVAQVRAKFPLTETSTDLREADELLQQLALVPISTTMPMGEQSIPPMVH
jgi:class 3 adenylate cyclase/tetratricopeptide (TPR) repeat protein